MLLFLRSAGMLFYEARVPTNVEGTSATDKKLLAKPTPLSPEKCSLVCPAGAQPNSNCCTHSWFNSAPEYTYNSNPKPLYRLKPFICAAASQYKGNFITVFTPC